MNTRHILMALALVFAAWLAAFGNKGSTSDIAEPIKNTIRTNHISLLSSSATSNPQSNRTLLAIQPRVQLIARAPTDRRPARMFGSQSWTPPAAPPPRLQPPPPAVQTAPPLPFTVLGQKFEDGAWEVYLANGEHTYIVREQTIFAGIYRVDSIKPPQLTLNYLPLNQVQTLFLEGSD